MSSVLDRFFAPTTDPDPAPTLATVATVAAGEALPGFTLAELDALLEPDERAEIAGRPEVLIAFARSLRESRQIAAGERPERFDRVATCRRCGPVWVPAFLEGQTLAGCRWCARRSRGLSIPRPER
jgi:hypothetical protein